MKAQNREIGALAEDLAVSALLKKGFQILEKNFKNRFGEIDIVAKDRNVLVFVEVKAKKGNNFGAPEEMISPKKLKRVQNMATIYTNSKSLPCRIDVVAVVLSQNNELVRLTHYENLYF